MKNIAKYLQKIFTTTNKKILILSVLFLVLAIALIAEFFQIKKQTQQALAKAKNSLFEQNIVKYRQEFCKPISQNISLLQNTNKTHTIAYYRDNYFVATSAGLIKYSANGQKLASYNNLTELSEGVSLATWADKLFIGTRSQGLLAFDGQEFKKYSWPELKTGAISALLNDNGRLLIGTFNAGLLEFDGNKFSTVKIGKQTVKSITSLIKNQQQLYIGTFDNGLWIENATKSQHFTIAEGLASNRVVGIVQVDDKLIVATDFGLSIANLADLSKDGQVFQTAITLPTLSGIASNDQQLTLVQDNGQLWQVSIENLVTKNLKPVNKIDTANAHIVKLGEQTWLASDNGLWQLNKNKLIAFGQVNINSVASNLVSALAVDHLGRLWIGYFRNGIDVFSPSGNKITHLENENLREINHISLREKKVVVATSQGLFSFDQNFRSSRLSKQNGLVNHNVTCSYQASDSENLLLATAKGLAIGKSDKFSLLTTVQGLPSNSTYSISSLDKNIYVATLTGLAKISNDKVIRTYKDANSNLKSNWITSLQIADKQLFIGTYGGGVYQLMPNGELRSFVPEIGRLAVNLNAMFSDNERLYVGTLNGLWVYQLNNQRWQQVKIHLDNVLSITGSNDNIYVGTTNGIAKITKNFFQQMEIEN